MGMTIDEAITVLGMVEAYGVCIEAKDIAVETMYKYQKIQEIINNAKDTDGDIRLNWVYEQIKGVVEDGNYN